MYLTGTNLKIRAQIIEALDRIAKKNQSILFTKLLVETSKAILDLLQEEQKTVSLSASNKGGWHSARDILKYDSLRNVCRYFVSPIEQYARALNFELKDLTLAAWANINRSGNSNIAHCHQDALFSGCFYLQMPDNSGSAGGSLTLLKKDSSEILATFYPQKGDLLLFPSDMFHQVDCYTGSKERISLAFNIHYGNTTHSWFNQCETRPDPLIKLDPYHLAMAKKNFPDFADEYPEKVMIVPFSLL